MLHPPSRRSHEQRRPAVPILIRSRVGGGLHRMVESGARGTPGEEVRKKKRPRRQKTMPAEKLAGRLVTVLERYRDRWDPKELAELARQLREFADSLDGQKCTKRAKKE